MNSKAKGTMEPVANLAEPPWSGLVERIRKGDPSALEQMYRIFSTGIRFYLCRQLGPQDLDDKVHDVQLAGPQGVGVSDGTNDGEVDRIHQDDNAAAGRTDHWLGTGHSLEQGGFPVVGPVQS